jgi:hypothetical protein
MTGSKTAWTEGSSFLSLPSFPGMPESPPAEKSWLRQVGAFTARWLFGFLITATVVLLAFTLAYLLMFAYAVLLYIYSPPNPG